MARDGREGSDTVTRHTPQEKGGNNMSIPGITETRQYLAFNLGKESFALDVANLREILEFTGGNPGAPDSRLHERCDKSEG